MNFDVFIELDTKMEPNICKHEALIRDTKQIKYIRDLQDYKTDCFLDWTRCIQSKNTEINPKKDKAIPQNTCTQSEFQLKRGVHLGHSFRAKWI